MAQGRGARLFPVSPSLRTLRRLLSRYGCSDRSHAFSHGLSPQPLRCSAPVKPLLAHHLHLKLLVGGKLGLGDDLGDLLCPAV